MCIVNCNETRNGETIAQDTDLEHGDAVQKKEVTAYVLRTAN